MGGREPELCDEPTEPREPTGDVADAWADAASDEGAQAGALRVEMERVRASRVRSISHGCCRICSRLGRSPGLTRRHQRIRLWHSSESEPRNCSRADTIWSSYSKGMSPHTKSYSRMPNDQTVAGTPWYWFCRIHSGGEYTFVPAEEKEGAG